MSTVSSSGDQSNDAIRASVTRRINSYIQSDAINPASRTPASIVDADSQSSTWVDSLTRLDRIFSDSLLRLCYNIIDIVLLAIGLYYGTEKCSKSNALIIISACILVFGSIALAINLLFSVRNWFLYNRTLFDAASSSQYHQGSDLRSVFYFVKFISICVSTVFVFRSKKSENNDCELSRFYLGIVCFNTWVSIFTWPPKPSLPTQRSLIGECLILLVSIIYNGFYFGVVAFTTIQAKSTECVYTHIEDLYFRAPLKSYAYVGLVLAGCTIVVTILAAILNQLFYRAPNFRRLFTRLSAIHYTISYFTNVIIVYYYSIGAVLLFQPRSGGSCSIAAPNFYKTLWIWQIIRVFTPVVLWPLKFLILRLTDVLLNYFAEWVWTAIFAPIFLALWNSILNRLFNTYENPPASPGTMNKLPIVVFGQAFDEFNQTECVICQTDFKINENIKRLPCGHLLHANCVDQWLSMTRICPVCRHRVPCTNL